MNKRKKKQTGGNNLKTAFIFLAVVLFFISTSLIYKLFVLFKESNFDGRHNFTVAVYPKQMDKKMNYSKIISFSPETSAVSSLKVFSNNNVKEIKNLLEIPIDGEIEILNNGISEKKLADLFEIPFFQKNIRTSLSIVDYLKLYMFVKTIPEESIIVKSISDQEYTEEALDRISSGVFFDYAISEEKTSIEIINGTGVLGLGNKVGRLLSNIGGNIVAVSTSDKTYSESEILYTGKSGFYTRKRLSNILNFKSREIKESGIADITIKIGEDSLK